MPARRKKEKPTSIALVVNQNEIFYRLRMPWIRLLRENGYEVFAVVDEVKAELDGKMEVVELTPEEKAAWKEATAPIARQFVEGADPVSVTVFEEAEKIQ